MSAALKKITPLGSLFIEQGETELEELSPAQRGIPVQPKDQEKPKHPKNPKHQKEPKDIKQPEGPKISKHIKEPEIPKYPNKNKEPKKPIEPIRQEEPKLPRERWCVNLAPDVISWAKRAVYHSPGLTLSDLVELAVIKELERMEKQRGEAFPPGGKVRVGRPVKF
jgi:hypothetical protein